MYTTIGGFTNGTTYISGDFGKYDKDTKNYSVKYGKNAIDNYKHYIGNMTQPCIDFKYDFVDFSKIAKNDDGSIADPDAFYAKLEELEKSTQNTEAFLEKLNEGEWKRVPLDFTMQYMPGEIKNGEINKNALMAASHEELGATEVDLEEFNKKIQEDMSEDGTRDTSLSVKPMDLNNDGKIDLAEYSTLTLIQDALSTNPEDLSVNNINGIITKDGMNKSLAYLNLKNSEIAYKTYSYLYDYYNLGEAQKEYLSGN